MKLQSQITAAFISTTLFAASSFAGTQTIAEMIEAADTSYTAIDNVAFSASESNGIVNRLLANSQMPMVASPLSLDGQMFLRHATDSTAILHIDTNGRTITFNRGIGDMSDHASTPALPTKEEAPAIAKSLLNELELAPARADELVVEHVGGLNMGVENADGETEVFEKVRSVRFGRQLGGQPVVGRGSRIQVQLGKEGEMRGIVRRWNEVEANAIAPEAKFSVEEIREMVSTRLRNSASHAKTIEFVKAELVLFDDGKGVIEPTIRVEVNLTISSQARGEDGQPETREIVNPLDFFIPILRNPQAELPFVKDIQMGSQLPEMAK